MYEIGKLIKEKRIENNLTLETLSNMTSISISTISKLENNKLKNISGVFLYRISKVLGINYNKLLRLRWDIFPPFFNKRKDLIASK